MESEASSPRAASDMLADALQQFDSILGSGSVDMSVGGEFVGDGLQGIGQLLDDLRITIQAEQMTAGDRARLLSLLPTETLQFYQDLFKTTTKIDIVDPEIKNLHRMKNENESLGLQVSVLTDQVELQMEKMEELMELSKELQKKLLSTEGTLQKEIQISSEREREVTMLKEQLRLQSKAAKVGARGVAGLPGASEQKSEIVSPDEGIVYDSIEVVKPALKMPDPMATSTPISALVPAEPRHTVKFDDETPKKIQHSEISTPKKVQSDRFMSASLERLHGRRIVAITGTEGMKKSSSQSGDINKKNQEDISIPRPNLSQTNNAKSCSSPNLAMTEDQNEDVVDHGGNVVAEHDESIGAQSFHNRKKHSFKKFFSSFRLRRSNSSNLQGSDVTSLQSWGGKSKSSSIKVSRNPDPFTRGGFRATAGPRLERSKPKVATVNTKPFAQWTTQDITDWLIDLGLDAYAENCKGWVKSGATLLQATNQDIEKELGIHNPLHKKKLMLSLQAVGDEDEVEGQAIKGTGMDLITVTRWLDDIGLPQYKDAFHKARIDCRMLHHLTIGDLQRLKVTNLLNMLSLRRAIYTLRKLNFDPIQLKRRPVDRDAESEQVHLWTNHRVMEWLRSIDLAEYAPNLRGSGVHGSLMVYEPQFTGEILASLLHIPTSKSLLRRHLVTKFNEIIPNEYLEQKQREASLTAVNIMAKVKIGRRSYGPLARLRGLGGGTYREFSSGEYVCPFETKNSAAHQSLSDHRRTLGAKLQSQESKIQRTWEADEHDVSGDGASDSSSGNIKIVELDESATKKIGAFSAELATMTNKWSED